MKKSDASRTTADAKDGTIKRWRTGTYTSPVAVASTDHAREVWAMQNGAALLAPGFVLMPELSSQGGMRAKNYKETQGKTGTQISYSREVDDRELDEMAQGTISKARYILYTHAARFIAGSYFIGVDGFRDLDKLLDTERANAVLCNKWALRIKSARVTVVDVYPLKLDVHDRRIAVRVGASIYERLQMLRDSYTGDNRRAFQTASVACTNMEALVLGEQREIIKAALKSAEEQRPLMIAHYGGRKTGKLDADLLQRARRGDFDYGPIDVALSLFEPAAETIARGR